MRTVCLGVLLALVAPRGARADKAGNVGADSGTNYVRLPPPHDIVIVTPGQRSTKNIVVLSALAGAAVVLGGLGLYENLDSKSAADQVSAASATGMAWSPSLQATYDRAHSSGVAAEVCYGIGGAFLVGAVAYLIATVPPSETTVIHPHPGTPTPTLDVGPQGAMLGGIWRW